MNSFIFRIRPDAPFWRRDKYETPPFGDQNVIGHLAEFRHPHRFRGQTEVFRDCQSWRHEKGKGGQGQQRSCVEIETFHWVELACAIFQAERITVQTYGVPGGRLSLSFGSNEYNRWGRSEEH